MATTSSTKPGEIGGTSILAKRSPSYRLVLKVDPTSGQYKYEYEVDDAPKVSDVIQSATPVVPVVPEVPDSDDKGNDTSKGISPTIPEDPGTSFEQTKQMLSSGGGSGKGPMQNRDTGAYRMNDDGTVGYRKAGETEFNTVSKTSPGAQRFSASLTKGIAGVTDTIKDYVSSGGIIGQTIKGIFSGKEKPTYDADYNQMPAGFVDGGEPTKPTDDRKSDSMGVSDPTKTTFNQTVDALSSSFSPGQLNQKVADLQSRRNELTSGFTKGAQGRVSINKEIANIDKEIQQTNSLLNRELSNAGTGPVSKVDTTTTPRGAGELGASTRSDIGEAVREGDIEKAVDIAKTTAGSLGQSRDAAQAEMDKARVGATTNNSVSSYGSNNSNDRREKEKEKDVAAAREAASNTEREPGTSVDKNNAVDSAARSNEVSDANGNAVTNTQTDSSGNKTTTAVGFGGNKVSEKQKADGAGGDKPGRIICTELYRQGLISKEDYMLDLYYTSKHLTSQHTAGYWHFAVPAVKAMRRSKFWTAFWREIAYNRLQDIKWRLGYGKFTLKGRIYSAIFEPFCYISGYFKPNATYKELYKGEY
jgi:hypothetical protein